MAYIRKRGNTYQIRVSCGSDGMGNQLERSITWRPDPNLSERDNKKALEKFAMDFENRCNHTWRAANIKFKEFAEEWFRDYAEINLKSTSLDRMKQLSKRVYPAIGNMRLDKITTYDVQSFINDLAQNGKNMFTGEPLSRKTFVHHLSFISDVFSYAIRMGVVDDNPCTRVKVPKGPKSERQIYTLEEMKLIFEKLNDAPIKYKSFFILAACSGFRRGELLGLEWKDIDWENRIISVNRTSNYTPGRGTYTDTTKTEKSMRSQVFSDSVMQLLGELKQDQDKERQKYGNKWIDSDRLFVKWDGSPMNVRTPEDWFRKFCERNGLPYYGVHSFRHFYASALLNANVDVATVSAVMGHSTVSTTTNFYLHAFRNAASRVEPVISSVLELDKNEEKKPIVVKVHKRDIKKRSTGKHNKRPKKR